MTKVTVIYKDVDIVGNETFTVYVGNECVGEFLEGDKELEKYRAVGNQRPGIDARY